MFLVEKVDHATFQFAIGSARNHLTSHHKSHPPGLKQKSVNIQIKRIIGKATHVPIMGAGVNFLRVQRLACISLCCHPFARAPINGYPEESVLQDSEVGRTENPALSWSSSFTKLVISNRQETRIGLPIGEPCIQ
jgi:hypothetical protein